VIEDAREDYDAVVEDYRDRRVVVTGIVIDINLPAVRARDIAATDNAVAHNAATGSGAEPADGESSDRHAETDSNEATSRAATESALPIGQPYLRLQDADDPSATLRCYFDHDAFAEVSRTPRGVTTKLTGTFSRILNVQQRLEVALVDCRLRRNE
jgi:hypothetical protein